MYYFIVNPVAGNGRCPGIMKTLAGKLDSRSVEYDIAYTEGPGHAEELAVGASEKGFEAVVAVGGDGTVMETAAGILRSGGRPALGIIPGGTGNDYRRSFGIPQDAADALGVVLDGRPMPADAGLFNGKPFFNIGSVGFDVTVVEECGRLKKVWGALAYHAAVFKTLAGYKCKKMRLWINGVLQEKEILISAIGNGLFYGNGMKVLPKAEPGDGSFDMCVVDKIPRFKIAMLFPQFTTGGHVKFPFVKFYRCEKVVIESTGEPFSVQTDGEVWPGVTSAEFSILPGALKVLAPIAP
jgi:YegS/Rv2252/BmrU family lipid kinase